MKPAMDDDGRVTGPSPMQAVSNLTRERSELEQQLRDRDERIAGLESALWVCPACRNATIRSKPCYHAGTGDVERIPYIPFTEQ